MTATLTNPSVPAVDQTSARPAVPQPGSCRVAVNLAGKLRVLDHPDDLSRLGRRTASGAVYRVDLGDGIACWLDGDHQDGTGEVNTAATALCEALTGAPVTDPWHAPYVCGPVLITGVDRGRPVGLTPGQLSRVVAAHLDNDLGESALAA